MIFCSVNKAILVVINGGCRNDGLSLEATAATILSATIAPRSIFNERVVGFRASATKKLLVLLGLKVGSEIVGENKFVRVSIMCMFAIVICDNGVVEMVTALPPFERARVRHVLVVLGAV